MANTIVERCRCLHAVVNDSVSEQGSDLFLMRSTIALGCGGTRLQPRPGTGSPMAESRVVQSDLIQPAPEIHHKARACDLSNVILV